MVQVFIAFIIAGLFAEVITSGPRQPSTKKGIYGQSVRDQVAGKLWRFLADNGHPSDCYNGTLSSGAYTLASVSVAGGWRGITIVIRPRDSELDGLINEFIAGLEESYSGDTNVPSPWKQAPKFDFVLVH